MPISLWQVRFKVIFKKNIILKIKPDSFERNLKHLHFFCSSRGMKGTLMYAADASKNAHYVSK